MIERRKSTRGRTYLQGRLAFHHKASTADCLVRNLTESGARVVIPASLPVPAEFEFRLLSKNESRPARFVWRSETEAGLAFLA